MNVSWLSGSKAVLDWYDDMVDKDYPYWSIWIGKDLNGGCKSDSYDDCREKLQRNLTAFDQHGLTSLMTLKLHDVADDKKVNSNTSVYASCPFKPSAGSMVSGFSDDYTDFPNNPKLAALAMEVLRLRDRITILEEMDTEEPETVSGPPLSPWMAIFENPHIQQHVIPALVQRGMGFLDTIMPAPAGPAAPGAGMGSMGNISPADASDQQEKINQAVQILWPLDQLLGDHLLALAIIARDEPNNYKLLLSMLSTHGQS